MKIYVILAFVFRRRILTCYSTRQWFICI